MILYLLLAIGCLFIGIRDLRKLKVEIEHKFGEIDTKTYDIVVGIYFAVYILIFVNVIPIFYNSSFGTVNHLLEVVTGA